MITSTSWLVWSTWVTKGTMEETLPFLAVEVVTKMLIRAFRAKSPEPPIPFIMWVPLT